MTAMAEPQGHVPGGPQGEVFAGEPATAVACVVAVLHRCTLQETVQVAYQDADVVGVLSFDVSQDPTPATLIAEADAALAALARDPEGADEDRSTVADVRFVWDTEPEGTASGLTVEAGPARWRATAGAGRYTEADAERFTGLLHTAHRTASADAGVPLSVLPLATADDLVLVGAQAGTGRAPVPARPLHLLIQEQAERTPEAVAVSCAGAELTYRGLTSRADRLALRLQQEGVGPGRVVGVLAERSSELVVALLAILKCGAAYAAFEPDLPAQRLRQPLADAGVGPVLAQDKYAASVPAGITVLPLTAAVQNAVSPVGVEVAPTAMAYVSFTSGSTGTPKGVRVPHAAVSRLVVEPDWAEFGPQDVFLQLAPVAFDASTLELWAPLVNGGRMVVHPPGPLSTEQLAATLVDNKVTVAWMTAGLFHQMVNQHLDAFAGLRHVVAGGDVVSPMHVRRLLSAHPGLVFTNGYGPTENTTFTTCWTSAEPPAGNFVPLGKPISGTRALVLDPELRPVPVGVPGELYAGGEGLAHGYAGRPGATAERFVPDPFAADPGARLYRTGDLVSRRPDGTLQFLGRADRQIKVQGYRVEPGEIETVLDRHEDVRQAVVVAQSDGASGKRLLAYITAERPEDDSPAALGQRLREWLRGELPGYMVPWAILTLPELPMNRNGKVDRAALPTARRAARSLTTEYLAARTVTESAVAEEWADLLGVEPVGMDDDFFELGGHSLIAADLLGRLQDRFDVELSARTLYLRPTVAELAEELDSQTTA
ncbi:MULTISPECIES: non-ribosomal peptide synthetase [Streptomyces]|uniref:Non-ribosomal peptide synthetase n=1 Tax=Streptomyces doebereineriae TaxID=3075528 RepID=A0ABU2VC69_9ACTN|nr:non-ribosomal peptide synthetase [Streptomyces sp. DSM 41640]MDT0482746.1 non-ribosomal peptide synthetase [Streptomyces sp. DSM 41640]